MFSLPSASERSTLGFSTLLDGRECASYLLGSFADVFLISFDQRVCCMASFKPHPSLVPPSAQDDRVRHWCMTVDIVV